MKVDHAANPIHFDLTSEITGQGLPAKQRNLAVTRARLESAASVRRRGE